MEKKKKKQWQVLFSCTPKSLQTVYCCHEIKRHLLLGRKALTNLDSVLKSINITLPTKVCLVKATVFPVVMYRCESWTIKKVEPLKNWCFQTVVLDKTLKSPLDSKDIKPVNPTGNKLWIVIGRTDAEAEAPILRWPSVMNQYIGKDPDAEKYWSRSRGQKRLDSITDSIAMNFSKLQETWSTEDPGMLQSMGSQRVGHDLAAEQQPPQQHFGRKNDTEVPLTEGL